MSIEKSKKAWEQFSKTNKAKDFAKWLLLEETDWHLRQIKLNTPDDCQFELNCTKNPIQKLIKANSKKRV